MTSGMIEVDQEKLFLHSKYRKGRGDDVPKSIQTRLVVTIKFKSHHYVFLSTQLLLYFYCLPNSQQKMRSDDS